MFKVGITGGIGSGKSTLCNMFVDLGIPVYNSDSRAKNLMSNSAELRVAIVETFGVESYDADGLNRAYLAEAVFTNPENLSKLNSIVHPKVKEDFMEWCSKQNAPYVILECAILFEAEFDKCVDRSLCVLSPKNMRVERVISRDGLTVEQIEKRIENQLSDDELNRRSDLCVVNFEIEDLEDAAKVFDKKFRYEAQQN